LFPVRLKADEGQSERHPEHDETREQQHPTGEQADIHHRPDVHKQRL